MCDLEIERQPRHLCLVSTCVLLLRYQPESARIDGKPVIELDEKLNNEATKDPLWRTLIAPSTKCCTKQISKMVFLFTITAVLSIIALCITLSNADLTQPWAIFLLTFFSLIILLSGIVIARQPQVTSIQTFKIPFVPFIPLLSVFINVYLMMTLTLVTWARFIIWFVIGNFKSLFCQLSF